MSLILSADLRQHGRDASHCELASYSHWLNRHFQLSPVAPNFSQHATLVLDEAFQSLSAGCQYRVLYSNSPAMFLWSSINPALHRSTHDKTHERTSSSANQPAYVRAAVAQLVITIICRGYLGCWVRFTGCGHNNITICMRTHSGKPTTRVVGEAVAMSSAT